MSVSVIITYYNKGELLLNAINSVYSEIDNSDEIIVINDCSDCVLSKAILNKAKELYGNDVLFIDTPINSGSSFAKDYGIKHSKNEFIVLLDADDMLPNDTLTIVKDKFKSDPSIALVYGNYIRNDLEKNAREIVDCSLISNNEVLDPFKLAKNWILLGTSPFRKSVYFDIGGFDKLYPKTDDGDFLKRLIVNNYKCAYINQTIYVWNRDSNGNNSGHARDEILFTSMRNFEFYFKFLNKLDFLKFIIKRFLVALYLKRKNKKHLHSKKI